METIKYLNEFGLDKLQQELGIKVSQNENYPDLYVLNYDQIKSPKYHPIVIECRSLVVRLEGDEYFVESRSFDRFFNYGEIEGQPDDVENMVAYQKIDGSLVSVWKNEKYGWLYRTRSMIMPSVEVCINGYKLSWKELIESVINFDKLEEIPIIDHTYIFEVVSPENRVVTPYSQREAFLLSIRSNIDGNYRKR
ncbi:MAG: hypothetical protein CME43_01905 [Haliea sp.]|uniref:RNA ligase n=1 Tax=Haliea sp. TaxID=1932666 RepID=UPI000C6007B5|nr:RNA ligase [Haliea sp.]MBM68173.1 hypothetical protein [Haliea sp.]MBM68216.1 hypothetical protein [Haliea sp.]|tara:strand:- start:163 stop:744 length:582 start_codon:yes stop_codon:yes gene_type:complete